MKAAFQLVLIRPDGYTHSAAFAEIAQTVAYGLRSLGAEVSVEVNRILAPGPVPIVFGANLLQPHEVPLLPKGTIIYNLEQIARSSSWCTSHYLEALRAHTVWDYSARNIEALGRAGVENAVHLPVGYMPELSRIPRSAAPDIDVLFYGSVNDRRGRVLQALKLAGLRTHVAFDTYGAERDALIARAKTVLNLHYYETSIFELVRVSYLLANRKAVIAECHEGTEIDPDIAGGLRLADYHSLVAACQEVAGDEPRRRALEEEGFSRMASRDEAAYLARALEATAALPAHRAPLLVAGAP